MESDFLFEGGKGEEERIRRKWNEAGYLRERGKSAREKTSAQSLISFLLTQATTSNNTASSSSAAAAVRIVLACDTISCEELWIW